MEVNIVNVFVKPLKADNNFKEKFSLHKSGGGSVLSFGESLVGKTISNILPLFPNKNYENHDNQRKQ